MNWLQTFSQIFKIRDLRNKILFVLGVFAIFRILANIPIPGVNIENLRAFFQQFQMLGILNIFTGGALEKLSIVMLGLGPYITATVILQLLTMIFPQLEELYREGGEEGRAKFEQYGRILTVPLAILQAFGMLTLFSRQKIIGQLSPLTQISAIFTVTAGSLFLMWLGELISEKGIGNGVSLLIFAGIIADFPRNIGQMIATYEPSMIPSYLGFFGMALIILAGVTLVNEARRNIPVSYAKRVRGTRVYGGVSTYLPLNINPAGVMPIIFALSILTFPPMIANFLGASSGLLGKAAHYVSNLFNNPLIYGILYFILVFLFTFFYTMITFEPKSISENLQKMGGFIPGIRPGESTAKFLAYVLNRILPIGALFLGFIALAPSIIQGVTRVAAFRFLVGGTSLLIIVSVVLETMQAIRAQLEMREYETF
jgi:preprotein translocase subunit SecY